MRYDVTTRVLFILFCLALLTQVLSGNTLEVVESAAAGIEPAAREPEQVIAPDVLAAMGAATTETEMFAVIVTLKEQANLNALTGLDRVTRNERIVTVLQALANASQAPLRAFLETKQREGTVATYTPFWVFNGMAVTATGTVIEEMAVRPEVLRITADETIVAPESSTTALVEPNLAQVNAPALWELGYRGQGIVVASLDSGVYGDHPDLSAQWRGGSNSWFDPYGEHPNRPYDASGHGTQTMGVVVGRDAGGSAIGMAPDAQWIAVKIFDDQGTATTSAIHTGFQWLLDPDGNPATADAPHIVNNSWGYATSGCNLEFQLDLQALRAMGIVPVFSAGNIGPYPESSVSPANNPEALAVGGVDGSDQIYWYSSRGPSACDVVIVFPDLVAPAVEIWSSNQYGSYSSDTGSSLAAPHVTGALALLLSAYGDLTAAEQEAALRNAAVDLGTAGPDNDFGYGRLDVLAAFYALQGTQLTPTATGSPPPATATATSTSTPAPTATSVPLSNVALNKPVMASSTADDSHSGTMAVDGDPLTFWQTKKAAGKKVSSSEWLVVDLGSGTTVSQVELAWDTYYATHYTIEVSEDNQQWMAVASTGAGDGGHDTLAFDAVTTRYIRLDSTGWVDGTWRNWLQEFAVYGEAGSSAATPTATETPGSTPTASPTPTMTPTVPPAVQTTVHVGDLDGTGTPANKRWDATVSILVHDDSEEPVANATVSGSWQGEVIADGSCVTDSTGRCEITLSNLKSTIASVSFAVANLAYETDVYQADDNHDPEGDSDGSIITVIQP